MSTKAIAAADSDRPTSMCRKAGEHLTIKRELRRRSAIEPIIGHAKSDGLLERNHLAGATGDAINAILVGAGHNIRLLLAWLRRLLFFFFLALIVSFFTSTASRRNAVASAA